MRTIDADVLLKALDCDPDSCSKCKHDHDCGKRLVYTRNDICLTIQESPTVGSWINVKDRLPNEHPSIFAPFYGTDRWNSAMWRNESDRVLVTIRFPDGTRTVDKGKLQDGIWKTGVSPVLPQEVTHWAVWPEPPKEEP